MAEVQWFFPVELREVPSLLAREGVVPHGGGTGIVRGGMSQLRGLMDVGRLGLTGVRKQGTSVAIGAGVSYAAAARAATGWQAGSVLARSLGASATTPLRNRITIGGSIALFPYWSDLLGPLLALEAELHLVGPREGWIPVDDYVRDRELRQATLITEVRWNDAGGSGAYRRWVRTHTDRPAFSLTVLAFRNGKRLRSLRAVLVGCSGRYRRLTEVEEALVGGVDAAAAAADAVIQIPARMGFSGDYLTHCARVELERALSEALGAGRPKGR